MTTLVNDLAKLDTSCVSDALDRLELPGVITGISCLTGRRAIAGRAITVELEQVERIRSCDSHLGAAAIEAASPGDVVLIDHQGRADCAGWGGKLSRAARARGLSGTIVFGAVRDIDESSAIGYPVFATSATPRTARGRAAERSWGSPIHVAGLVVAPGDLVLADSSGVVIVAALHAASVLATAKAIATTEERLAADIDAGLPVTGVMGTEYESMLSAPRPGSSEEIAPT